jgi:hypothetical protein
MLFATETTEKRLIATEDTESTERKVKKNLLRKTINWFTFFT